MTNEPAPFAVFTETLKGSIASLDHEVLTLPNDDRGQCGLIADHLIVGSESGSVRSMTLADLEIAVDVANTTPSGGLEGMIRAGRLEIEGIVDAPVDNGYFELFGVEPRDGLRMRYALIASDTRGVRWLVRGTKLVVDEAAGNVMRRMWRETTTLYVTVTVLTPSRDLGLVDARELDAEVAMKPPANVDAVGIVHVAVLGFARQLASLRGEPGPGGGMAAIARLGLFFAKRAASVYLNIGSVETGSEDIEDAFAD